MFPRKVRAAIEPYRDRERSLAFVVPLIIDWVRLEMDPKACRRSLENMIEHFDLPRALFRPEGIEEGGMFVTDDYVFPTPDHEWELSLRIPTTEPQPQPSEPEAIVHSMFGPFFSEADIRKVVGLVHRSAPWVDPTIKIVETLNGDTFVDERVRFKPAHAADVESLFRVAAHTKDATAFRAACHALRPGVVDRMLELRSGPPEERWPEIDAPGIYRREHASLVIRSKTTTLLVDPICFWRQYHHLWRAPTNFGVDAFDGILITHGHADHYNIPSILYYAQGKDTPVVVPRVPRVNGMSPVDMQRALAMFGQSAIAPQWHSTLRIGDIAVDILPFYGEQPTRDAPGSNPAVRNWGNCYRVTTPEFSALILADSGTYPAGTMSDVLKASVRRRGPADALLCSLPRFLSPFFLGLDDYYTYLPFSRLQELFQLLLDGTLPSVTPGAEGAVASCEAACARYYLPYGNGFRGVGEPVLDVSGDGQPSEAALLDEMRASLSRRGVATDPLPWNTGDAVHFADGRASLRPYR